MECKQYRLVTELRDIFTVWNSLQKVDKNKLELPEVNTEKVI